MRRHLLIPGLALLAFVALPAAAQESGGVGMLPGFNGGPVNLARPLPFTFANITAGDVQNSVVPDAQQRRQQHQDQITRLRGDAGFLAGFSQGQPLAASRQRQVVDVAPDPLVFAPTIIRQRNTTVVDRSRTRVVNNSFEGPVAITRGNGNIVQQQGSAGGGTGGGAVAQQQVATIGGGGTTSGGGNTNVVLPSGGIRQAAPGARIEAAPRRVQGGAGGSPRRHAAVER